MKRETMWEQNATQREINNMKIVCWRCCSICCWNSSTNIHAAYFLSLESHRIGQSIYGVFFRGIREMWINRMEFNVLAISIRLSVCVWCTELSSLLSHSQRMSMYKWENSTRAKVCAPKPSKLNDNIQPNRIRISHLVDGLKSSCESNQLILEHWT